MPDSRPIEVLLVEDDRGYSSTVIEILSSPRFHVELCETMPCTLEHLSEKTPDVVLLDLCIPGSSGIETVETVHAARPDVPIVVLSGLVDEPIRLAALRAGAQNALEKGEITAKALVRVVVDALEHERQKAIQRWKDEVDRLTTKIHRLREEWGLN